MLETKLVPYLDALAIGFSLIGVFIIIVGGITAFYGYLIIEFKKQRSEYDTVRRLFGRQILLSLEFFIAADLIKTIATPNFVQIGQLAAIVGIRIVFAYFLGREIT